VVKKSTKEWLVFLVKIIISLIAIIYVFKRVILSDILQVLGSAKIPFLLLAILIFGCSKVLSAHRTLLIMRQYSIPISGWDNLKLYWTGMFYNLFLPGGIGGDIYKTVVINNNYKSGIKISAGAVLMDRIAGVAALIVLAQLSIPFTILNKQWGWISVIGVPPVVIGFIGIVFIFMPILKGIIIKLLGWSFMVQGFQILSVFFILKAFNINANHLEYLLIFLISSIAAMLPISVGGIGIREFVFFSGSDYFLLDQKTAVTISFTFYLITALVSSLGIKTALEKRKIVKVEQQKNKIERYNQLK
jgi:uncharacterized membrane protein YbhN (UPF0104 family)